MKYLITLLLFFGTASMLAIFGPKMENKSHQTTVSSSTFSHKISDSQTNGSVLHLAINKSEALQKTTPEQSIDACLEEIEMLHNITERQQYLMEKMALELNAQKAENKKLKSRLMVIETLFLDMTMNPKK